MVKTVLVHKDNDILAMTEDGGKVEYDNRTPDTIKEYLSTKILSLSKSEILWWSDLSLYTESIISFFNDIGLEDVTGENPTIKAMRARSYKYIIANNGTTYAIYIRMRKCTLYIYNTDNLLLNLTDDDIISTWGNGKSDIRSLAEATCRGIVSLNGFQEKRTPYTLSMVASRSWKTIENLYFCDNLIDCNSYKAPGNCKKSLSKYIRESYQAGWNYATTKKIEEYKYKPGKVYDINSSYPYIMRTMPLPWGEPIYFEGEIPEEAKDEAHYYYVRVKMQFKLKDGAHFPYIRKRGDFRYKLRGYLDTSDLIVERNGKVEKVHYVIGMDGKKQEVYPEFVFTQTDYELIHRHYDIIKEEVIDGVYFRVSKCTFKHFIDHYYNMKMEADRTGDKPKRMVSKMIMNSVCGSLAKREERINIVYDENMQPSFVRSENPSKSYIHIGSAILSYAREYVYEAACKNYENFLYSDTDSLHLTGDDVKGIELNQTELGKWKVEHEFINANYNKAKSYTLQLEDGSFHIVMAGMSNEYKRFMSDLMYSKKDITMALIDLRMGKYGNANNIARMTYSGKTVYSRRLGKEVDIYEYTHDVRELSNLINDINNTEDLTTILQYCNYPTGFNECDDFIVSQHTDWKHINL